MMVFSTIFFDQIQDYLIHPSYVFLNKIINYFMYFIRFMSSRFLAYFYTQNFYFLSTILRKDICLLFESLFTIELKLLFY